MQFCSVILNMYFFLIGCVERLWMGIQLQVIQLQLLQLFLLAARRVPHPEYVLLTSSEQLECLFDHSSKVINE